MTVVPAPDPRHPPAEIGDYVPGKIAGQSFGAWTYILTAPGVRRVGWKVGTPAGQQQHSAAASSGLAVADNGLITSDVRLTGLTTPRGVEEFDRPRALGVPGNGPAQPVLAVPRLAAAPAGFAEITGFTGYADLNSEYGGFSDNGRAYALWGSCYGPGAVRVNLDHHPAGSIPCDSQPHLISVPASAITDGTHNLWLTIWAGPENGYSLQLGTDH
jgi:hypothetical protein